MDSVVSVIEAFISLFQAGAETFMGFMKDLVPLVLIFLVAMNTITALVGEERVNNFGKKCSSNPFLRYLLLPMIGLLCLSNPMGLSMGQFLPEKYKPGYFSAISVYGHTLLGLFPHANPGELFVFLGIANGISKLGFSTTDLAFRYFLVGMVLALMNGMISEAIFKYLSKAANVDINALDN